MANTQPNNSPFIPTLNFAPAVEGISTSPFTDQRAVATGGGTPGTGDGNVSYNEAGSSVLSFKLAPGGADIVIDTITQPDTLTISSVNDATILSEEGDVTVISDTADVGVLANQDVVVSGDGISAVSTNNSSYSSNNGNVTIDSILGTTTVRGGTNATIESAAGSINVSAPTGPVTIQSGNDALLESTTADVGVVAAEDVIIDGSTINAASTNNSLYSSSSGNVTVDSVLGTTTVRGGTNARIESAAGSVNVAALNGPLAIDGNVVDISSLADMDLASNAGDMTMRIKPGQANNLTANIQMLGSNLIGESEISLNAGEVDICAYTTQSNGVSLQTRDITTGNTIAEFALNSAVTNSVPDAVVGRNVQYFQFATRDPNFHDGQNLPNPLQPTYRFSTNTGAWRFIDRPNVNGPGIQGPLQWNGNGDGSQTTPYELSFANAPTNSLALTYDEPTSTLTLSDPVDGDISSTVVVPGRTILKTDLTVNGTNELSCIGLSNTIFPPPAAGTLVGNNPPRVEIPASGEVPWFPGASFRATIAGTVGTFIANDTLTLRVYSNRGQGSTARILNTSTITLQAASDVGWKWEVIFTCRDVTTTTPAIGLMASNSKFDYTLNGSPEGSIVSNTNSAFFASSDQYLDFTLQFNNTGNAITTNLCMIERIY